MVKEPTERVPISISDPSPSDSVKVGNIKSPLKLRDNWACTEEALTDAIFSRRTSQNEYESCSESTSTLVESNEEEIRIPVTSRSPKTDPLTSSTSKRDPSVTTEDKMLFVTLVST